MELVLFLLFAGLALGAAVVVILHPNPVYSVMSLMVVLAATAVLFVLLSAPFVAVLQVLIYTGAVLVLFLFVIMLLDVRRADVTPTAGTVGRFLAGTLVLAFATVAGALFARADAARGAAPLRAEDISTLQLARELFSRHLLGFELVGLLLLVALVGATVIARRSEP